MNLPLPHPLSRLPAQPRSRQITPTMQVEALKTALLQKQTRINELEEQLRAMAKERNAYHETNLKLMKALNAAS
jgi:uncharacterized protein YhaN